MARRGFSLLEVIAACVLLAAVTTLCLRMLDAAGARRRAMEDRQLALQEIANLTERLSARPWDELTPQAAADARLSEPLRQRLVGAELKVQIADPSGDPVAKRIEVSIRWCDRAGEILPAVRLVAWKYQAALRE